MKSLQEEFQGKEKAETRSRNGSEFAVSWDQPRCFSPDTAKLEAFMNYLQVRGRSQFEQAMNSISKMWSETEK